MRHPAPRPALGSASRLLVLALACGVGGVASAQTGTIGGTVTEAETQNALVGANVLVIGTTVGASASLDGTFEIPNAPAGPQRLRVSFVGYTADTLDVVVPDGGRVEVEAVLAPEATIGEVVVSAQLEGQREAIAQQLESNQIVNVVSADRIREVPDQNAVESIGRLPGISVQRNAGEGQKVVVRGLSPRFNNVTVNGQRVPATDGGDRSVDLSLISQDALEGIEVYKSLTPDQDGDAIGGSVNLVTARAPRGLRATLDATGGYNGLNDALGDYRVGGSVSRRFLGDRLGAVVSGTAQRADRGSRQLDASYQSDGIEEVDGVQTPVIIINSAVLADRIETRERYNANLALDLELAPGQALLFNGLYARTDRDELRFRRQYRPSINSVADEVRDRELSLDLASASLRGEHDLSGVAELTWQGAAAQSLNRTPLAVTARFLEPSGIRAGFDDRGGPRDLPMFAVNDSSRMQLNTLDGRSERTVEANLAAQADLRVPFGERGRGFYGFLKTGAKVRDVRRSREESQRVNTSTPLSGEIRALYPEGRFRTTTGLFILTADNFFTGEAGPVDFFGGDFPAPNRYDIDLIHEIYDGVDGADGFFESLTPLIDSYDADETISAGYVMAELNLGPRVMVLPGVRYEYAQTEYRGVLGDRISGGLSQQGTVRDTTAGRDYGEWLPMVQARVRPADWLDLRVAVTRTLNRPDYRDLVPFRAVNYQSATFREGDPNLLHAKAWNVDVSTSLYSTRFGLLSVGGFYKSIDDLVYTQVNQDLTPGSPFFGLVFTRPVNAEETTTVRGLEVDVQTNLSWVPGLLSGVVFNANYARVWSETAFPTIEQEPGGPPFYTPVVSIGTRLAAAPLQSDHIANASLGYERFGFSGRVSLTYQSNYLDVPSVLSPLLDASVDDFVRWDLSLTQRLGGGLVALASVNNLTSLSDRSFVGLDRVANEEQFGWTGSLGLRFRFDGSD